MPTKQYRFGLEDGSGLEVYYQHGSDRVGLDASGTYFVKTLVLAMIL